MIDPSGEILMNLKAAKRFIGLVNTGYKDYLGARFLLNGGFLHQGIVLANTSIEKQLKGYLIALGLSVSDTHDSYKLYTQICKAKPDFSVKLNRDFLKVIAKVYRSRYFENLGSGYNFVIVKNKFLAELDYSYSLIEPITRYKLARDKDFAPTMYEVDIKNKDIRLVQNNYLLTSISKNKFLNYPDQVYEFRIAPNHEVFEVYYNIPFNVEHERFVFEGMKPVSNSSFEISHNYPEAYKEFNK